MKAIIRFLIIGSILGGALGAKVGAYLSRFFDWQPSMNAIESGFIYGVAIGVAIPIVFSVLWVLLGKVRESRTFSSNEILSGL